MSAERTDVLIVGAGAYGLSSAWWMSERKAGVRILVVDGRDFAANGTGSCGAGVRMQWGLALNIRLAKESIGFFEQAAERLDYPQGIDFKQRGYLILARDRAMLEAFRANLERQHAFGVPSQELGQQDALRMVPGLNPERLVGATFCPKDGTVSPFRYLDALLRAAERGGVEVRWGTTVERLEPTGGVIRAHTNQGTVEAAKVLLCNDWAAPKLLKPLGIDLPIHAMPNEAMVTEPWPATLAPCIVRFENGTFINQVPRGSIVCVVTRERPASETTEVSTDWLAYAANSFAETLPGLAHLNVVRTWCHPVSMTPDMQGIIGEMGVPNLFVAVSAYKGFMTSPAVGRIMAELVLDGRSGDPVLESLHPRRFAEGKLVPEPMTV